MHRILLIALCAVPTSFVSALTPAAEPAKPEQAFRAPAVPLVAHDPYFSIWSPADRLTDAPTVHWTGARQTLESMVRIDGMIYRVMGSEPKHVRAMPQTGVKVLPTRTIYEFQTDEVRLTLTFMSPLLPDDLEVMSRPVTYITWQVASVDAKKHAVQLYYGNSAEPAVNTPDQLTRTVSEGKSLWKMQVLKIGAKEQPVLAKKGDNLRIDWGYLYAAASDGWGAIEGTVPVAVSAEGPHAPAARRPLPEPPFPTIPHPVRRPNDGPVMVFDFNLGEVGPVPVSRRVMLAYDDLYSIVYFQERLRPYWRRNGADAEGLLKAAQRDYEALAKRCEDFDSRLMADLEKAGGPKYAQICALAYRQCIAGGKLCADAKGLPLWFPKENFSNGCISTVDVVYPACPQLLLFSPALTKAMLVPVLDYAVSPRWKFPFAPHDLGTYPMANGQVYGGGEKTEDNQMPVEESGNMLLVLAALAHVEGNADFAKKYWPVLTRWAEFLKSKGLDPENQLCTDDFAGHLAHNVNLSVKAIVALGAFAKLCEMAGHKELAADYRKTAEQYASRWILMAADGDHTRLAFDKPGTWSQKYNLVWDRILGLNLFPATVAQREVAYYKKIQNRCGLPLDNRQPYTKLDWSIWTASLADAPEDFAALVEPVYLFLQCTPQRVPMTDWYWTKEPKQVGFQARPVIGGVFIKPLYDAAMWKKWADAGQKVAR
jgi:hypothetical protein